MRESGEAASVIRRVIESRGRAHVEDVIFGTEDPERIASLVDEFCRDHLGAGVARYLFYTSTVASVHGLRLQDGRSLVLKAHQPRISAAHLVAVQRTQAHLRARGFPCPEPLLGPTPIARGLATAEAHLPGGDRRDGHEPAFRRAMAFSLARLVDLCRPLREGFPSPGFSLAAGMRDDRLWPEPHSPMFDFHATTAGAGWIDATAAEARECLQGFRGEEVVGHADWSAQNVRFDGREIVAAYDWESLTSAPEPILVGGVAHAFPADWHRPAPRQAPTLVEARAFVGDYEAARGRPFDPEERRVLAGAFTYAVCYTARCAHALDPDEGSDAGFRRLLREEGSGLLAL